VKVGFMVGLLCNGSFPKNGEFRDAGGYALRPAKDH